MRRRALLILGALMALAALYSAFSATDEVPVTVHPAHTDTVAPGTARHRHVTANSIKARLAGLHRAVDAMKYREEEGKEAGKAVPEAHGQDPQFEPLLPPVPEASIFPNDHVYNNFTCPSFMKYYHDAATGMKKCLVALSPILYDGVPWGPVVSTLWSGDIGYWMETVQVEALLNGWLLGVLTMCPRL